MLTQVLQPASCKAFKADNLSAIGAAPGFILSLKPSSKDTKVIPYSLSFERSAKAMGRIPFASTEHLIPASLTFLMAQRFIFCILSYSYINGSVVKHKCNILILFLNLGSSRSRSSNVFFTSAGVHQSS